MVDFIIDKGREVMVKVIFFDIDGTLLSLKSHQVPESSRRALEALRKKGIKLFLATGRSPAWLDTIEGMLDFKFDGYVMLNGQYCIYEGKVLRDVPIPVESLESLLPYIEENKIACEFVEEGHMYINLLNERVLNFREKIGGTGYDTQVEDLSRIHSHNTYQLLAYVDEEDEKEFLDHMPNCKMLRWCPEFADVVIADGGKDKGIEIVLDYMKVSKDECMAFGDGGNDIAMLKYVGRGIAMGNANPPVKEIADFVTRDIDDDGIEYALKYFGVL